MDPLVTLALLAAGGYLLACAVFPFAACRWCNGTGKHRSFTGKAWRQCKRCSGSGRRVRVGRRLFDAVKGEH